MKKKLLSFGLIAVFCLTSVFAMTACGDKQPYSDYDLSEYVKVGKYKGLEYDKITVSVSDQEIQDEIKTRLKSHAVTEDEKEGTVADGDVLKIDYTGKVDGKEFEGGSAENASLTIGSGQFIDGFEDGLIGKNVGETATLDLTFPEDYGKDAEGKVVDKNKAELAGKPVVFEVKIKSRQVEKVPEYNMEFIKKYYSDYDSLKAFEASVKKDLLAKKETTAKQNVQTDLWKKIVDQSKLIKYPEEKDAMIDELLESYKKAAKDNDLEWEEYLKQLGTTEDELKESASTYAEHIVLEEMILYSIADKEDLAVTEEEYDEYLDALLSQSGMDEKTFESTMGMSIEKYAESNNLRSSMLLSKVMDKVMEYGKEV